MMTPSVGGMIIGFVLIFVAACTKKEKWQVAYAVVGLIFIFWSLNYFSLGRLDASLVPALTLLFGLFSMYTKGNAQMISMLVTLTLFFQIVRP